MATPSDVKEHDALSDMHMHNESPFDYQEYHDDSELNIFLQKEDLLSLKSGLSLSHINLSYLKHVELSSLNQLCDKLKLEIGSATRLQFTRAVVKLHDATSQSLSSARPKGYDYIIKCILLGDSDVGKSCMLLRYVDNTFAESRMLTVGIDYRLKTIELGDHMLKYQIWDTAGQEKYRNIISAYYRGIDAALLCYDITNRESFENVIHWIENVQQHFSSSASLQSVFMMIVGTKLDLINDNIKEREVDTDEGQQLADEYNIKFCEVSSKTGHGVNSLFLTTAGYVVLNKQKEIDNIEKQRVVTQEKVDLIKEEQRIQNEETENSNSNSTDKFVKKKCCSFYI